jgi:hypothetical protein
MKGRMGKMFRFKLKFGKNVPHIIYDGIQDEKVKNPSICIESNTNQTVANIKAADNFKGISKDITPFICSGVKQAGVVLNVNH